MDNRPSAEYESVVNSLRQGPRRKTDETKDLEIICKTMLRNKSFHCSFNMLDELEVRIGSKIYNLTQILKSDHDFSHLSFTKSDLEAYANFVAANATMKPVLPVLDDRGNLQYTTDGKELKRRFPSPQHYLENDPTGKFNHLSYAEKLAITLYTTDHYANINNFLRMYGASDDLMSVDASVLNNHVKELLLVTAIATHGLNKAKPQPKPKADKTSTRGRALSSTGNSATRKAKIKKSNEKLTNMKVTTETIYRVDHQTVPTLNANRVEAIATKKPIKDIAFTSSSLSLNIAQEIEAAAVKGKASEKTLIYYERPQSALLMIEELTAYPGEGEVLYAPGTQFSIISRHDLGSVTTFKAIPVRPVEEEEVYHYSSVSAALRCDIIKFVSELHDGELDDVSTDEIYALKKFAMFCSLASPVLDDRLANEIDSIIIFKNLLDENLAMLPHIKFVYENYLSQPYTDTHAYPVDLFVKMNDRRIEKPNHNLATTLRTTFSYLPLLLDYFKQFSKEADLRKASETITAVERNKIQLAMLFSITGRECDLGFVDDPDKYKKYREKCGKQFSDYVRILKWDEDEIKIYAELLVKMGDPTYITSKSELDAKYKLAFHMMNLAHKLDLARCYSHEEYAKALYKTYDVVEESYDQKVTLIGLMKQAIDAIRATGDRLHVDFVEDIEVVATQTNASIDCYLRNVDKTYDVKFVAASTNPRESLSMCTYMAASYDAAFNPIDIPTSDVLKNHELVSLLNRCVQNNHLKMAERILDEMRERKVDLAAVLNQDISQNTLLCVAVNNHHPHMAELLIKAGADPSLSYHRGITPLHIATKKNDVVLVELLIKHGADINRVDTTMGAEAPIHVAIINKATDALKTLLANGADPNMSSGDDDSPLHSAINGDNTEAVATLLAFNADMDQVDFCGRSALEHLFHLLRQNAVPEAQHIEYDNQMVALCMLKDIDKTIGLIKKLDKDKDEYLKNRLFEATILLDGYTRFDSHSMHREQKKILRALLEVGLDINHEFRRGGSALFHLRRWSTKPGSLFNFLLRRGINPAAIPSQGIYASIYKGSNILHAVVFDQDVEKAFILLERFPELAQHRNTHGVTPFNDMTPLCYAIKSNWTLANVIYTLDHTSDVNETISGKTPLEMAVEDNQSTIVELLVQHGADPLIRDKNNTTILEEAYMTDFDLCYSLIRGNRFEKLFERAKSIDELGLLLYMAFKVRPDLLPTIQTQFDKANKVFDKYISMVDALLAYEIPLDRIVTEFIALAIEHKMDRFIDDLIAHGFNRHLLQAAICGLLTPLSYAIDKGNLALVQKLISYDPGQIAEKNLLFNAIVAGNPDILAYLIKKGLSVTQIDTEGRTSLHYLAFVRTEAAVSDLIELFISAGVDINAKTKKGKSALHLAILENREDLVEALLLNDADPNLMNNDSVSPLSLAVISENYEIVKSLLAYGAELNKAELVEDILQEALFESSDVALVIHALLAISDAGLIDARHKTVISERAMDYYEIVLNTLREKQKIGKAEEFFEVLKKSCIFTLLSTPVQRESGRSFSLFSNIKTPVSLLDAIIKEFPELKAASLSNEPK